MMDKENTLVNVTRFEIVDHRPCSNCKGKMWVLTETDSAAGQSIAFKKECPACQGRGVKGREVIFWDKDVEVEQSLQDNGRTLKLFIKERG